MNIKGLLYASTTLIIASGVAHAQLAAVLEFHVPAGSLRQVAAALAAQADATVSFSSSHGLDVTVRGVAGEMTLDTAMAEVLAGSGWHIANHKNGVVSVVKDAAGANVVVVQGDHKSFTKTDSNLLTRTDTSIKDTPGTVDEVPQAVLQSQNATSLQDALRNVPGVFFLGGHPNQVIIDGDSTAQNGSGVGGTTFTNGLRNASVADNAPTIDVESIEVLKGPSSIVSGDQVQGGLVNYVPKRANGTAPSQISLGAGSGTEFLASVDTGGKFRSTPGLAWRFIGLDQTANTASNVTGRPRQYELHPMLGYTSDRLKVDLGVRFYDQSEGLPKYAAYNPVNQQFSVPTYLTDDDNNIQTASTQFNYNVEYTLISNDALTTKIRAKGLVESADTALQLNLFGFAAASDFGTENQYDSTSDKAKDFQNSHYLDVYNKFYTGPIEHQLIIASDFSDSKEASNSVYGSGCSGSANDPGCTYYASGFPPQAPVVNGPYYHEDTLLYGIVIQDQMNWDRLHILAALRKSWYSDYYVPAGSAATTEHKQNILPSAGIAFDLTRQVTVYLSYQKSFNPNPARDITVGHQTLPPQLREQYEAGIHTAFLHNKLDVNTSVFTYSTSNSALQDPANPFFVIPGPGQKTTGFEISTTGAVTPTLNVVAGYSYIYVKSADGLPVLGKTRSLANLWVVKTVQFAAKQTLDFGIGGNYNDGYLAESFAQYPETDYYAVNRYNLTINAEISYHIRSYDLNFTANDILNQTNYYPGAYGETQLEPGRDFRLVLTKTF